MAQPFNFTFGQDFFNAYQQSQRQKEEERQFNLKFGEEQRQRSLLDAFKQKQYELDINKYNLDVAREERLSKENPVSDLYEDLGTVDKDGKPFIKRRNKQTGEIEYEPAYKSEAGGLTALGAYTITKDKEEKATKLNQAQLKYNEIMDSYDPEQKAYVINKPNGVPEIFTDEKSLRKYAVSEVLKMKPPGKINFWTREQKQAKEKTETNVKGQEDVDYLISKGKSKEEALLIVKKRHPEYFK